MRNSLIELMKQIDSKKAILDRKRPFSHEQLVRINPFIDGNGRTARLLMNLILLQNGYPTAIIRVANRANYILALETAQNDNQLEKFYQVICQAVDESIDSYLLMLEQEII